MVRFEGRPRRLRGEFNLMLIMGGIVAMGNVLLGTPAALLLGIIYGLIEVVPGIGPALAQVRATLHLMRATRLAQLRLSQQIRAPNIESPHLSNAARQADIRQTCGGNERDESGSIRFL